MPRQRDITGSARLVEAPVGDYRTVELGSRGQLRALHQGPLGGWVAYLADEESRAYEGRSLPGVLGELFELPQG